MSSTQPNEEDRRFQKRAIDTVLRIALLAGLLAWCLLILAPFLIPVIWGIVIAIALHGPFVSFSRAIGDKPKRAAVLMILVALLLLLAPTWMFLSSITESFVGVAKELKGGTLTLPLPPDGTADLPLIGEKLEAFWIATVENTEEALRDAAPQLKKLGEWLLSAVAGLALGALQFAFSLILAGVFLATAQGGTRTANRVAGRLLGDGGGDLVQLCAKTIRSVAKGVIGVAAIQSVLAGIGMALADVPGAGAWALVILILAIIQLPPLIVLGPAMIYVFSASSTTVAVMFTIWSILVGVSDSFLKPMLMGRGVDVPMLVILVGAIGGMMTQGILGLFVGAVVLAVGYQLFMAWSEAQQEEEAEAEPA